MLPMRGGKALQMMAITSPSDSTISGGGSHILTNATLALQGQDEQLTRDTSPGHHLGGRFISPEPAFPRWPSKMAAGACPAHRPWAKGAIATPGLATNRTPALADLCTGAMQILWLNPLCS